MRKIAFGALCFVASLANAASWEPIGGNDVTTIYLAKDRLSLQNGHLVVWSKWVYRKPRNWQGKEYTYTISQDWVDCSSTSSAMISSTNYSASGVSVHSETWAPQWKAAVPESTMENIIETVCK
jgi:hypothetical protein